MQQRKSCEVLSFSVMTMWTRHFLVFGFLIFSTNYGKCFSIVERHFFLITDPSYGPQRHNTSWEDPSLLSCVDSCISRYPTTCWTVMYNDETKLCTPGWWLQETVAAPTVEEGMLYKGYDCESRPNYQLYTIAGRPLCLAFFSGDNYRIRYAGARQVCKNTRAHLATIKRVDRFDWVSGMVNESSWIGLDDKAVEGTFVWLTDGSLVENTNIWAAGEPSGNYSGIDEDCVAISSNHSYRAADFSCSERLGFVCEAPMNPLTA